MENPAWRWMWMCSLWEIQKIFSQRCLEDREGIHTHIFFSLLFQFKDEAVFIARDLVLEADLKFQLHCQQWWKHHPIFVPWVHGSWTFHPLGGSLLPLKVSLFFLDVRCYLSHLDLSSLFLLKRDGTQETWYCIASDSSSFGDPQWSGSIWTDVVQQLPGCWPPVPRVSRACSAWRGSCELQPYCLE